MTENKSQMSIQQWATLIEQRLESVGLVLMTLHNDIKEVQRKLGLVTNDLKLDTKKKSQPPSEA